MKNALSLLREARKMIINAKLEIDAVLSDPSRDSYLETSKLHDALSAMDNAYDSLCDASDILED